MEPICLQGRTLSGDDLTELRALIAQHPDWHRTALSRHLCELWNWRNGAGRLKDMAARTLLLKLQARGMIKLPPPQTRTSRPCAQAPPVFEPKWLPAPPTSIDERLAALQPVSVGQGGQSARGVWRTAISDFSFPWADLGLFFYSRA
ncbi:MAG: hypothetical protein WCK27_06090 [Verrucomicrobiota bacterium]